MGRISGQGYAAREQEGISGSEAPQLFQPDGFRGVEIDFHRPGQEIDGSGQKPRRVLLHLFEIPALVVYEGSGFAVRRAGNAQREGQGGGVAGQADKTGVQG
jgi:hypothetical protein